MCNFYPDYFLLDIITWVTCIVSEGPQCDTPQCDSVTLLISAFRLAPDTARAAVKVPAAHHG